MSNLGLQGENGLHFVAVEPASGTPNGTTPAPALRLRSAGPALEAAAPLATGSTPTVSIGDCNGDGGLALLAGTALLAEGRFYLSRWTAAGGG